MSPQFIMTDQRKYTSKLHSSRILIIGGTSGIGFCVAEACVENGARVTISSSNPSRIVSSLTSLKKCYPSAAGRIRGIACDLSDPATLETEMQKLFEETVAGYEDRKLDHVIFTAGDALSITPLTELSMEKILQAGQIRFFAPLLLAKYIPQYLISSHKSSYTITTGSISEKPTPNWSVVASYAGGHHSMVRNLALDLKPIRVNGVSPGVVNTELWRMGEEEKREFLNGLAGKMPTGVAGRPEEVAESYLVVLRDCNMDGSVVRTDGGGLLVFPQIRKEKGICAAHKITMENKVKKKFSFNVKTESSFRETDLGL
ncbi:NAD(P)-binding protein [Melanomma pulvis-pyrius CBS 109.77]|uniref:NAD(P)-binding protein n=1 Tax=Melanomma pulvis-pyrius CBS 109.77 TaxID=1314802 RepID=A0A6A6XG95_9PLEO|nr:NAD(P)-binding protein [Melanomma pulvis-pyrius CBS 109.77]